GNGVSSREGKAVPHVEVAASVFRSGIRAVLREIGRTIQGIVVQAMTVGVTGDERKPVRSTLGKGHLHAVVVGIGNVRFLVDKVQIREWMGGACAERIAVGISQSNQRGNRLIQVLKSSQSCAVVADIANFQ